MSSLPVYPIGGCHPHLPVRMPCGFLEVSYGTVCLPVPLCLSVSSLLGTPLVMSSFQSSRSSSRPTYPHRPSPRPPTRRAGRLTLSCGAFHVRTPWYNSPSFLIQSLIASPACLLPHAHQSLGSSPSIGSDCGNGCGGSFLSARLSAPFVSFMLAPPNRHGERGEGRGGLLA